MEKRKRAALGGPTRGTRAGRNARTRERKRETVEFCFDIGQKREKGRRDEEDTRKEGRESADDGDRGGERPSVARRQGKKERAR